MNSRAKLAGAAGCAQYIMTGKPRDQIHFFLAGVVADDRWHRHGFGPGG
jgi:hypothetical protein